MASASRSLWRRPGTLISVSVIVMLVAGGFLWISGKLTAEEKVPIIVYLVDTLRVDRLGIYDDSLKTSPRLDALARESVVFEQAYAPAPWTLPSLASFLTSTFPCEHGVITERHKMDLSMKTLPERLREVGYFAGGRYQNFIVGPMVNLDQGYQDFEVGIPEDMPAAVDQLLEMANGAVPYIYLHTLEPHDPNRTPYEFFTDFGHVSVDHRTSLSEDLVQYRRLTNVDWSARDPLGTHDNTEEQEKMMAHLNSYRDAITTMYDASVLWADYHLGDVIDKLKERGIWDKAIFVFLSDHGEEFGEHGGWFHEQSGYEELVHVPLLIRFPRSEFAGQRVDQTVSLLDIMPTLFDYIGEPGLCDGCRGVSLLPILRGIATPDDDEIAVRSLRHNRRAYFRPWKESRGDLNVVVRRDEWKGIWNEEPQQLELYDLRGDPGERADVSADHPELAQAFRSKARTWLETCLEKGQKPAELEEFDEETQEQLRSLGYLY